MIRCRMLAVPHINYNEPPPLKNENKLQAIHDDCGVIPATVSQRVFRLPQYFAAVVEKGAHCLLIPHRISQTVAHHHRE